MLFQENGFCLNLLGLHYALSAIRVFPLAHVTSFQHNVEGSGPISITDLYFLNYYPIRVFDKRFLLNTVRIQCRSQLSATITFYNLLYSNLALYKLVNHCNPVGSDAFYATGRPFSFYFYGGFHCGQCHAVLCCRFLLALLFIFSRSTRVKQGFSSLDIDPFLLKVFVSLSSSEGTRCFCGPNLLWIPMMWFEVSFVRLLIFLFLFATT